METGRPAVAVILRRLAGAQFGTDLGVRQDSVVRTGADPLIVITLDADAVGIGRPHAYGLAIAGGAGAREVLENLIAELDLTMGLLGCRAMEDVLRTALSP